MVHLRPLPGSPLFDGLPGSGALDAVIEAALADAEALDAGGIDAIMIENYGDVPFLKGRVEPVTVAAMTRVICEIARITRRPLGVNVLRNDPISAVSIAAACGASMIRVNVHTGAMVTDQGMIEGNARETIELRRRLGASVTVMADVNVKHAMPAAPFPVEVAAADAVERGLADALIVTGPRTGAGADVEEIRHVEAAVDVPVFAGSGVTAETVAEILSHCDGAIVGSWLKKDGRVDRPVDRDRVRRLVDAVRR
jgi:membrane complex biogenesis BtpA family protein